jgi:membrane protein implicated in regulation of membrane protease activity
MKNLLWVLLGVLLTLAGIFLLGLPVWLLALGIAALCFLLVFSFLCRVPTHIRQSW